MRLSEHLYVVSIEVFVVIVLLPLVERDIISIQTGLAIAVAALALGLLIERVQKRRARSGELILRGRLENELRSGIDSGERYYSVHTWLFAKFENAQDVQDIITGGKATLWRKRRWLWPKRLSESFDAHVRTEQAGYMDTLPPEKLSLAIAPRTISAEWRFFFAMTVPAAVNPSRVPLFVKVKFDTLGSLSVTAQGTVPPLN